MLPSLDQAATLCQGEMVTLQEASAQTNGQAVNTKNDGRVRGNVKSAPLSLGVDKVTGGYSSRSASGITQRGKETTLEDLTQAIHLAAKVPQNENKVNLKQRRTSSGRNRFRDKKC